MNLPIWSRLFFFTTR